VSLAPARLQYCVDSNDRRAAQMSVCVRADIISCDEDHFLECKHMRALGLVKPF
jgi:hypothetical protein